MIQQYLLNRTDSLANADGRVYFHLTGDWDLNYTNNFSGTKNIVTTGVVSQFTSSHMVQAFVSSNNTASDVTIFNAITTGGNQDSSNYVTVDGELA